jgi:GTPase SAR1 family protein
MELKTNNNEQSIKLLLMGDSGVGKTAILIRYVDGEFSNQHFVTIGQYV